MNSTKLNQDCSWLCVLFLLLPMVAELAGAAIDKKKTTVLPPPTKKTTKQQTTTKRTTKTVQPQKTQSDQGGTGSHAGPNGYRPRPGDQTKDLQGGGKEYHNPQTGQTVTTNARGEVQRIEAPYGSSQNKIVISRGARGTRVVATGLPGAQVVSYGPNRGFVERSLPWRGYISRTYVIDGRSHATVYRQYTYHNVGYYRYVPRVYYNPQFYVWARAGWRGPVPYAWFGPGLPPAPWFSFYAGYFTPSTAYSSPDVWLTDYLLAENLRLAYENQQPPNPGPAPPPPGPQPGSGAITPEMKEAIANEVQQQVTQESTAAQLNASGAQTAGPIEAPPTALTQKFFVVSSNLDLTVGGQTCSLTPGDIIERRGKDVAQDGTVAIEVVNSKQGDCAADTEAALDLNQLQEMHNQFQEQIDSGLNQLANHQAKGLPAASAAGERKVAEGTADPVPDAQAQIKTQEDAAAQVQAQVGNGN